VLLSASELALVVLMGAMGVLWLIATIHHLVVAEAPAACAHSMQRAQGQGPRAAGIAWRAA
jgi:hypothetical protein